MATLLQSTSHFAANSPNTLAFPNAVSAGSMLVAYASSPSTGTVAVSDNVNGSYNKDVQSFSTSIWTFPNAAPGGTTVTMTFSLTVLYLIIEEWAGVNPTSPLDRTTTNSGSSATSGTTGTTATLAQASELVLAIMQPAASAGTAASGPFTPSPSSPIGNVTSTLGAGYLFASSTAGVSATFTWTSTSNWHGAIATYKIPVVSSPPIGNFIAVLP